MTPRFAHLRRASLAASAACLCATSLLVGDPPTEQPQTATPIRTGSETTASDAPASGTVVRTEAIAGVRERLARNLAAFAARSLRKDELAMPDIELSMLLAEQAVELNPEDLWAWRILLGSTSFRDPADSHAEELRRNAVQRIVTLDPGDEAMRYRRLVDVIEAEPTAEARIAKYQQLLDPKNRDAVGSAVAARLALDFALLCRRTGDPEGFEQWLGTAVTLDPSYPAAAVMAAGYFRFATDDLARNAELMIAALTANPLDPLPMRGFATDMLDRGAYRTAARFLNIAAHLSATDYPIISYDQLLGDLALATWGAGRPKDADEIIRRRQAKLNEFLWGKIAQSDPTLLGDPERVRKERFPVPSSQLAVRAAVLRSLGDDAAWKKSTDDTYFSLDSEADELRKKVEKDPELKDDLAAAYLQAAFFAYWIGEDAQRGESYVKKAAETSPLTPEAEARFQAWSQLRRVGEDQKANAVKALAMFQAIESKDDSTRLGTALSFLASNQPREAAMIFLAIANETPGTLVGVDARSRLEQLIGTKVPQSESAVLLEKVGDSVPETFDRMFREGTRTLGLRITLGTRPMNVTDSIPAIIDITNNSPVPLAIDSIGPIRDLLAMQATITVAGRATALDIPYMMIPIDRALSIPSRSTLSVPIDLAYTDVGISVIQFVQQGCAVALRGLVNWETTQGGFRSGAIGDKAECELLRIDGSRLTDEWIRSALDRGGSARSVEDLIEYVAVIGAAAQASTRKDVLPPGRTALFEEAWKTLPQTLASLDPLTQAWLLVVLPDNIPPMEPALSVARSSTEPIVRLSYLIRRAAASTDPALDAAIRSDNPRISRYGRLVKEMQLHDEELTRRDYALGTSGAQQLRPGEKPPQTPPGTRNEQPPSEPPPSAAPKP